MIGTVSRPLLTRAVAAVAAGLAVIVVGSILTTSSPTREPGSASPAVTLVDPVLDDIIDSLLNDDAAELQARFGGVTARAGAVLGGPIGLNGPQVVGTADWTSRLASATRAVHAVVKDPREPFDWWDQPDPGLKRAAIFAEPRDFDIVLIVGTLDGSRRPWRFSVSAGRVVDIVIDTGVSPDGHERPLVRALGYLTPSPDDEPERFIVLPPHEMRPAPPRIGLAKGEYRPASVASPAFAPDGRTGDPAIDALIDLLLRGDASGLARAYPDLAASQERCDPSCDTIRVSPAAWTSRLAAVPRSLYAVFTGDPSDADVLLAVDGGGPAAEAWTFRLLGGRLGEVAIDLPLPLPIGLTDAYFQRVAGMAPSPAFDYERFYVLPPQDRLPEPPPVHSPSTRTGVIGVDALLAILDRREPGALFATLADPAAPLFRGCQGSESRKDAAYAATWAEETARQIRGVHSVTHLPDGYQPRADHLMIAIRQLKPYWWEPMGILERQGKIVGVITSDDGCSFESLYAARSYVVPPPEGGLAGLDASRRSGIPLIDRLLDAVKAGDQAAVDGLIEYSREACGDASDSPPGAGPPPCPSGIAAGTPVDVFPMPVCHGDNVTRDRTPAQLIEMVRLGGRAPVGLYAVTEAGPGFTGAPGSPVPKLIAIIASPDNAMGLEFSERGVMGAWAHCGPAHPEALIGGGTPSFLLPPR